MKQFFATVPIHFRCALATVKRRCGRKKTCGTDPESWRWEREKRSRKSVWASHRSQLSAVPKDQADIRSDQGSGAVGVSVRSNLDNDT